MTPKSMLDTNLFWPVNYQLITPKSIFFFAQAEFRIDPGTAMENSLGRRKPLQSATAIGGGGVANSDSQRVEPQWRYLSKSAARWTR